MSLCRPFQVQTVLKKVPITAPNHTEPVLVNRKRLEYKWGMNVLGELMPQLMCQCLPPVELRVLHVCFLPFRCVAR